MSRIMSVHKLLAAVIIVLFMPLASSWAGAGRAPDGGTAAAAILLTVVVGETLERDVGFARGSIIDDPTIARVELKSVDARSNRLTVKGLRAGATLCRVGTEKWPSPSFLFEIRVVEKK